MNNVVGELGTYYACLSIEVVLFHYNHFLRSLYNRQICRTTKEIQRMIKTMKSILVLFIFAVGVSKGSQAQTNADAVLGKWTNEDKSRVVEFVKAGSGYEAVIRAAPDPALVGKKQLTGLVFGNGKYAGIVWLPKRGKSYPCVLKMKTDTTLELTANAGFTSKSQVWTKLP